VRIISHRGCLEGPDSINENRPHQIDKALSLKFDVELDLWMVKDNFFLGHCQPQYQIKLDWLLKRSNYLWVHCKNIKAIDWLSKQKVNLNYFFHQCDHLALTSKNVLWVYPSMEFTSNSVIVASNKKDLENSLNSNTKPFGICTDYPISFNIYKQKLKKKK
jgi:hypothetical protein